MYAILDTNILYYWTGIQHSDFDSTKISTELSKYTSYYIPLWSLIEIITSTDLLLENKISILEFISEKRIPIHGISSEISKIVPSDILQQFKNGTSNETVSDIFKFKFKTEQDLLVTLIESSIVVLAIFYDTELSFDNDEKRKKFTIQLQSLILGNRTFLQEQIDFILRSFYADNDGKKMRDEIQGMIYSLFYVATLNYENSTINTFLMPNMYVTLTESEKKELKTNLSNNTFLNKILKTMKTDESKSLIKSKLNGKSLMDSLVKYENEMKLTFSHGLTKYYSILIRKLLTDGTKIEKNDIIDSLLLNYYPAYIILTAETRIRKIIKEIDEEYSKNNENFIKSIVK